MLKINPMAFFGGARWADVNRLYRIQANCMWAMEELEKLGASLKWDDGEIREIGVASLRVHWKDIKPTLNKAVRQRGVNVLDRTMLVDLLTNKGKVVGATAVNTRTGEFIVIKSRALVLATANLSRGVAHGVPLPWKYKFAFMTVPKSGDGWAAAYRAGGELVNMEQSQIWRMIRDELIFSHDAMLGEQPGGKVFTWDGEEIGLTMSVTARKYEELDRKGRTPLYYSFEHWPEDYHRRMEGLLVDTWLGRWKLGQDRGFNPRTAWFEMAHNKPYFVFTQPGLPAGMDFMTSMEGVYTIGDGSAGCHSTAQASTAGLLVGDTVGDYISKSNVLDIDEAQVESQREIIMRPLSIKEGTEPMEFECAISAITDEYASTFKSEGKLREGLLRLKTLRRVFLPQLMAKNPHYLGRCLEARNILDVVEVHMQACLARDESRGEHYRVEKPEPDPAFDGKLVHQCLVDGKPVVEWKDLPEWKLADSHREER
jgi:succinate dehydrogenase/fumarate reductase flavoprotein subunit